MYSIFVYRSPQPMAIKGTIAHIHINIILADLTIFPLMGFYVPLNSLTIASTEVQVLGSGLITSPDLLR